MSGTSSYEGDDDDRDPTGWVTSGDGGRERPSKNYFFCVMNKDSLLNWHFLVSPYRAAVAENFFLQCRARSQTELHNNRLFFAVIIHYYLGKRASFHPEIPMAEKSFVSHPQRLDQLFLLKISRSKSNITEQQSG
jgi:hypothetical protein